MLQCADVAHLLHDSLVLLSVEFEGLVPRPQQCPDILHQRRMQLPLTAELPRCLAALVFAGRRLRLARRSGFALWGLVPTLVLRFDWARDWLPARLNGQ